MASGASESKESYDPPSGGKYYYNSMAQYEADYKESISNNDEYWAKQARELLHWDRDFTTVSQGGFKTGDMAWFLGGELNVSVNCVDRHLKDKADKIAILWEGDTSDQIRKITFRELHEQVNRAANLLKNLGVRRGDNVCIYMPMIPETAYVMLACTRVGAVHSVVFAGFSAQALADRIMDCKAKVVFTCDQGVRGGRVFDLKKVVDEALEQCKTVEHTLVWKRTGAATPFSEPRDIWLKEAMENQRPYCPPERMNSEDPLFLLYTSGSTGNPKGILHSTGGYLTYAAITLKYVFDYQPDDVYACVADIGWITGHTYIIYGPLANGATTFMFESTPLFPDAGRYWDMVERHKINQFYTAPTAIRAVQKFGDQYVTKYDRSSLRVLGSVGEPINPEAWLWYHDVVGNGKVPISDTYWQTETGGHIVTPLPGATPLKPSAAAFPFFGIDLAILDPSTGALIEGNDVEGVLCVKKPWPGMARSIYNDHSRFIRTYLTQYPGYYFTGDGARRDKDGYYFITGRVDDVLNVSGHRIGTAEVEAAIGEHQAIVESAVIGIPHDIKGQTMFAFLLVKEGFEGNPKLVTEIKTHVREQIGKFASVEHVVVVPGLPKTRSGKIMRRLLRKIGSRDTSNLGDISTLADSGVVDKIMETVNQYYASRQKK